MSDNKNVNQDKGLQGNEKIEQAIATLQQEATQEMLAHTLTAIRRRMRENGQFILSVEPPTGDNQLRIGTVKTGDGKVWWAAFTGFEEEVKGGGSVQSTFLTDIDQLFHSALQVNEIEGIILNPWNRTIMLDEGRIILDLGGEERAKMGVNDLLDCYAEKKKKAFDNDRMMLAGTYFTAP